MFSNQNYVLVCSLLTLSCYPLLISSSSQGELVGKWAENIGKELSNLGQIITKSAEIKLTYSQLNAQVIKKDPKQLLDDIITNVHRMLHRKMNAIQCILKTAETEANIFYRNITDEQYTYHSSKYSPILGEESNSTDDEELPDPIQENMEMYLPLNLNNDTHFYNIAVDTNISSVHVPTNIYDRHMEAKLNIQWSEALHEVFKNNYESDPALSWQYFGSSSGVMRHYPAMKWPYAAEDLFDCRIRTWYIEAATCTKDVVILIDNSGSMQGMNNHIASLTANSILDTFSNNDNINVMNYSSHFNYTVPCFKDTLIKATRENVQRFKAALRGLDPEGKTNVEKALIGTLDLLKRYRDEKGCDAESTGCNQAIMLITDGVSKNLSDVLMKYNSFDNGTATPVRIFTYLIGAEVSNKEEISWIACHNRGYYSHVESLEQVTDAVFKYINVIARPLVLQSKVHPISWTHAYADPTSLGDNEQEIDGPLRLLTSTAMPAFDFQSNENNQWKQAHLLGVAGTDVPIDDIQKLTFPYKIGVNAHAFIISNNGYILMHPGLRPIFRKKYLKPNYNSVDLTEVLQLDDGLPPRNLSGPIKNLRTALIHEENGEIYNISLKYHYNDMQRVSRETFDFYFSRLNETPFTIALAFSNRFGYYAVQVPDEIKRNRHTGKSILDFFNGTNWKIHPKWVYCKYHYLEGHEYNTPEEELLHFLGRMYLRDFEWSSQYEEEVEYNEEVHCKRKTLGIDDYYCNKDLIQMLIFDARSTMHAFGEPWKFINDRERILFERYDATLRFVSTMSGLTRWEYIFGEGNETKMEFGDFHSGAQDETWYKSAVLQHQYDPDSFVYSVPVNPQSVNDLLVTGSYAIFPKDAGMEAPASVVGFQFSHNRLTKNFFEITNAKINCEECTICSDLLDCYVIDSSGYILVSGNEEDTGNFFGEVQRAVMESMLHEGMFDQVTLYDYQAICYQKRPIIPPGSKCSNTFTQYPILYSMFHWIVTKVFWWFFEINVFYHWNAKSYSVCAEESSYFDMAIPVNEKIESETEGNDEDNLYFPCDQQKTLFILNQTRFIKDISFDNEIGTNCSETYYVKRIPYSNLLLVAVNISANECNVKKFTSRPEEIKYPNNTKHPCQKLYLNSLPRRMLTGCFNNHYLERDIKDCGWASSATSYNYHHVYIIVMYTAYCLMF